MLRITPLKVDNPLPSELFEIMKAIEERLILKIEIAQQNLQVNFRDQLFDQLDSRLQHMLMKLRDEQQSHHSDFKEEIRKFIEEKDYNNSRVIIDHLKSLNSEFLGLHTSMKEIEESKRMMQDYLDLLGDNLESIDENLEVNSRYDKKILAMLEEMDQKHQEEIKKT